MVGKHNPTDFEDNYIPTEHEEQRAFVQWFRRTYPEIRIFAIPNGGARNMATAGRLKAEGVVRGVPDLFIPAWRTFIEMKRIRGGRLSPEQKDWKTYLESIGYRVWVCAGFEGAKREVDSWLTSRACSVDVPS